MEILTDACAIVAVIVKEPERDLVIQLTQNSVIVLPNVVSFEIAWEYKIYAYDAFYLESAKRLGLPLLTFDGNMAKIGKELGIKILGGKNVGI